MYRKLSQRGFTLIELLIVIAIIGILATVAIVAINPEKQLEKARDAQRKADLAKIQAALEQFHADHGFYPVEAQGGNCSFAVNDIRYDGTLCGTNLTQLESLLKPYLSNMPTDPLYPLGDGHYNDQYLYLAGPADDPDSSHPGNDRATCFFNSDGTKAGCRSYLLEATLENDQDPDYNASYAIGYNNGSANVGPNYRITSP